MSKLLNIAEGWGKSLGLFDVTEENKQLSIDRLTECAKCPFAVESSFLKILKGGVHDMAAIKCEQCGCPVNEKSLVITEQCPEGRWKK